MNTSDILNKAADLIEERGWIHGSGWPGATEGRLRELRDQADHPLCLEGGIMAALGMTYQLERGNDGGLDATLRVCPAYQAVRSHLDVGIDLFRWNDNPQRTAAEVIETLRAAALIEQAREAAKENAETRQAVGAP